MGSAQDGGIMLYPVIMVGCGGSGIKSVRYIRESVMSRLAAAGWDGPMPAAWQFIGLDTVPGQSDLGEVPALPSRDYLQVSANFRTLAELYQNLRAGHHPNIEGSGYSELAGWLPSSTELRGNIQLGAGKLRAVGRAVGTYALTSRVVKKRFQDAFAACESGGVELAQATAKLVGIPPIGESVASPLVVVIGSSAGGTGAGIMLDTMDMLRRLGDEHVTPMAVVYGPDIFADRMTDEMVSNNLGFMSEMLSAYWSTDAGPQGLFPAPLAAIEGRGPWGIFLVGKANMVGARLENAAVVYRAVGETIASWVTNEPVADSVNQYVINNRTADAAIGGVGFAHNHFKGAVSSFGAASIAVGRSRFRSYAKANLMREFYDFHWNGWEKVAEKLLGIEAARRPQPVVLDELAKTALPNFMQSAGLQQLFNADGRATSGITDVLISAEHSLGVATAFDKAVRGSLPADAMGSADWQRTFQNKLALLRPDAVAQGREEFEARLNKWAGTLAENVLREANELVALLSLPVAIKVIEKAIQEVQVTAGKFRSAADFARTNSVAANTELWTEINGISGTVKRDSEKVTKALKAAGKIHSHDLRSEALARLDNVVLLVVRNLLQPMKSAMQVAFDAHVTRVVTPQSNEPAISSAWPKGQLIPSSFLPSSVEYLLEDVEMWPNILDDLLQQCVIPRAIETPRDAFRRVILTGDRTNPDDRPPLLWTDTSRVTSWNVNTQLPVQFKIDLESMDSALSHWMNTTTAISNHLKEGLRQYLEDPANVRRLDDFKVKFQKTLQKAKPLIEVDNLRYMNELSQIGNPSNPISHIPILDKLPFDIGHPAREIAAELLRAELGLGAGADMTTYFQGEEKESSVVSSFLSSYIHPSFVKTFTEPLATQLATVSRTPTALRNWSKFKRARTIDEFIPVPKIVRLAFVRGFVVGRLLGQISLNEDGPIQIVHGGEVFRFPFPLLSPIQKPTDALPALLESFCLEFRNVPTRGTDAFEAYEALYHKAVPVAQNDSPAAFTVGGDLKKFIDTGSLTDAAIDEKTFAERQGATPEDRKQKIVDNLERMVKFYQGLKSRGFTGFEMRTSDGNIEDQTKVSADPGVIPEYGHLLSMEIIDDLIGQYSTVLNVVKNYVPGIGSSTTDIDDPPV
jgi:hypothetical protein